MAKPLRRTKCEPLLAVWLNDFGSWHGPRWLWALQALVQETAQGFQYVGLGLALLGLFVSRTHSRAWGGAILIAGVVALHALILCRMASLSGYLSERHVLIFVLAGCIPAGAALLWLGNRLRPATGFAVACGTAHRASGVRSAGHRQAAARQSGGAQSRWTILGQSPRLRTITSWIRSTGAVLRSAATAAAGTGPNPKYYFAVLEGNDNQHSRLPALKDAKVIAALRRSCLPLAGK